MRKYIIITGGNGQLGTCIKSINKETNFEYLYLGHNDFDITSKDKMKEKIMNIGSENIYAIINCAAYTNVDKSELDKETSKLINSQGPLFLSEICCEYNIKLIHISTDFVSPKNQNTPLKEIPMDENLCINIYGATKCAGENNIIETFKEYNSNNYCIIRTSWLYSEYHENFLKTIYKRIAENKNTYVVDDQIGSPTYAVDLADFIIQCVINKNINGIINFRNLGSCSWYDFAKCIETFYNSISGKDIKVIEPCSEYYNKRPAKRPNYSILDIRHANEIYNIPYWQDSVYKCIKILYHLNFN